LHYFDVSRNDKAIRHRAVPIHLTSISCYDESALVNKLQVQFSPVALKFSQNFALLP